MIDNIFTNQFNPDFKCGNLTIGISDHLPSFMICPKNNQNHLPKKHNIYRRDTKRFNKEDFLYDFLHINWDNTIEINKNDVNCSFDNFMAKINNILDKNMPYKKVSNKEFKNKYKPWINKEIIDSINKKISYLISTLNVKILYGRTHYSQNISYTKTVYFKQLEKVKKNFFKIILRSTTKI